MDSTEWGHRVSRAAVKCFSVRASQQKVLSISNAVAMMYRLAPA